jgi:hypothetical protein
MSTVFRNKTIQSFDHFTTTPQLSPQTDEETSAAVGFHLGGGSAPTTSREGLVFALLLGNDTWTGVNMTLDLKIEMDSGGGAILLMSSPPTCEMVVAPSGLTLPLAPEVVVGGDARGSAQVKLS